MTQYIFLSLEQFASCFAQSKLIPQRRNTTLPFMQDLDSFEQ